MLYGDDDTLFYLPGVLRLLSSFDPEQPLAITDNIWYYQVHPSPYAPRCLPCGFNTSTIKTNHSFTPRPACPFCTRALACGTYSPRYRCNATHMAQLERDFGPRIFQAGLAAGQRGDGGGGPADPGDGGHGAGGGSDAEWEHFRRGMRNASAEFAGFFSRHWNLKLSYPFVLRNMPSMDWEMRDPPDTDELRHHRRRSRRSLRGLRLGSTSHCPEQAEELDRVDSGDWIEGAVTRRRRLAGLTLADEQPFVDGTRWLSAALGFNVSNNATEAAKLRLPYPFCARHDERLHGRIVPNCLSSPTGHGGTGIIFSVGLMRLIKPEEAISYITSLRGCAGGDCLLGRALWYRMGVGFTDPGTALQHGTGRYAEKYARFVEGDSQGLGVMLLSDPMGALLQPRKGNATALPCGPSCVWLIENVVGTHIKAKNRDVSMMVDAALQRLRSHSAAYAWVAAARRDPEVAAGRIHVAEWVQQRYRAHSAPPSPQARAG